MLTKKEKTPLYDAYFKLVGEDFGYVKVQSKNTRDIWLVRQCHSMVETLHRPKGAKRYHHQCNSATVASAVKKIRQHDEYKLRFCYGKRRRSHAHSVS